MYVGTTAGVLDRAPGHPVTTPGRAGHASIPQHRNGTAMCHEREREMSHPDPRHLAEANGAYPYELPVHDSAITGTGTGMPGADTRQYEEWHHADPPPRGAGGWDAMREFGPPPDWTDEGVFIAGDDDRQHGVGYRPRVTDSALRDTSSPSSPAAPGTADRHHGSSCSCASPPSRS